MNRLGIAGDYLLGNGVSLQAFPLDWDEKAEKQAADLLRLRVGLITLLYGFLALRSSQAVVTAPRRPGGGN